MTGNHNPSWPAKPSARKGVVIARLLQDLAVPGRSVESSELAASVT